MLSTSALTANLLFLFYSRFLFQTSLCWLRRHCRREISARFWHRHRNVLISLILPPLPTFCLHLYKGDAAQRCILQRLHASQNGVTQLNMCHLMTLFHDCSMTKDESKNIIFFCHFLNNIVFFLWMESYLVRFVMQAKQNPPLCWLI